VIAGNYSVHQPPPQLHPLPNPSLLARGMVFHERVTMEIERRRRYGDDRQYTANKIYKTNPSVVENKGRKF
jgi:hypothetical protein